MQEKKIFARKRETEDGVEYQSLEEHLRNVASRCALHAAAFDSAEWGRLIGLLHDIGKAKEEFQIQSPYLWPCRSA